MTNTEARNNTETVKRGVESACLILLYVSLYRFCAAKTGHFPQTTILYFLFVVVSDSLGGRGLVLVNGCGCAVFSSQHQPSASR